MEKTGFRGKKTSAGGGIFRLAVIFVLVASAAGAGIWLLWPHPEKCSAPAQKAVPAPATVPETLSVPESAPLSVSTASQEVAAPADDPESVMEKKVETAVSKPAEPAEKEENLPVLKGVAHASDPADEGPYSAPDLMAAEVFSARMAECRSAEDSQIQAGKLQALLKDCAFASPQYREAAKLLNESNRNRPVGSIKRTEYTVKPGDSLIRLARKFHLPTIRLAAENGLEANAMLKIGQKLQVPETADLWSIRISKRARLLQLYRENELVAVYEIGIGRRNLTPEGRFILRETVDNPPYPLPEGGMARPGSPENQLGACWLGLGDSRLRSTGYGIHGTPDESSVTRNLSAGCIRMRNKEVLELRSRVPVGTPVMIEN